MEFYGQNLALFTRQSVKCPGKCIVRDEKILKVEIANPFIREGAVLAANNEETSMLSKDSNLYNCHDCVMNETYYDVNREHHRYGNLIS